MANVRVLVVDDDRDTVMTLGILLRSEGFEVTLVQEADAVAAAVAEASPHAVLMDLRMPGRSGLEIAAELREKYGARCPLLVAVTALTDRATRQGARASGFGHFIAKPYHPLEVLRALSPLGRAQPS